MKILVTGASGCVGRAFLKEITKKHKKVYAVYNRSDDFVEFLKRNDLNERVIPVSCDLMDEKGLQNCFKKGTPFEYCVYLAASINVAKSIEDPAFDLRTNAIGLINLLKYIRIKRLVFMSSTSVYDGLKGKVSPDSKLNPVVPYGVSKMVGEYYVRFFAKKLKTVSEYAILRLSGAYGPYSPAKKIYNRIIKDFYFDKKDKITLFGDGKNLIDLLYVNEIARAIMLALASKNANYTVDICSGTVMTLNELIKKGASIFGIEKLKIKHTPFPNTEKYMTYTVLPHVAQKTLGFVNSVSYEEGLLKLAKFYEEEPLAEWRMTDL